MDWDQFDKEWKKTNTGVEILLKNLAVIDRPSAPKASRKSQSGHGIIQVRQKPAEAYKV